MSVDVVLLKLYVVVKIEKNFVKEKQKATTLLNKDEERSSELCKKIQVIHVHDNVYLEFTSFRLIMIPIGNIIDIENQRDYKSILHAPRYPQRLPYIFKCLEVRDVRVKQIQSSNRNSLLAMLFCMNSAIYKYGNDAGVDVYPYFLCEERYYDWSNFIQ